MAKKMNMLARIIYAAVGLAGIFALIWAIMNTGKFVEMGLWNSIGYALLTIGGINWGIVALSGKRERDLFYYIGM